MTTFTMNGISSTTIPELAVLRVRRPLGGKPRHDFVEVPGRAGFWLFEEEPGARRISLDFHLLGDDFAGRRAAVIALADLLDQDGLAKLIVDDEPDRFHRVKLADDPDPDEWLLAAEFSVDLIAQPYSEAVTPSVETINAASASPTNFDVDDKVYALPVIEITAVGGTIVGYSITVNGFELIDGDTIGSGATKTINGIGYVVLDGASTDTDLDGTFDPADLDMTLVDPDSDFPVIVPGTNVVVFAKSAGTATSATVEISWRRRSR